VPRWIQVLVFVLIIGFILLFAFGLRARGESQLGAGPAPDFSITSFEGQRLQLSELRGKVVVINIWASWCAPCRDEAPFLERTWRQYKDRGVVFIGVDYVDSETAAKAYLKEFGITYFNGPDIGSEIYQRFRAKGVPETYFVGKDGNLYGNVIGPITRTSTSMTERAFVQKLEELLAK
jgi:cytochrome c biogenesis protein CcmG/thiol:disulfide interchange protein DsbE